MNKPEKDEPEFEPIRPTEDMDRMPWLRYLPDFTRLPRGAQVALVALLLLLVAAASALGWCSPRVAHGSPLSCEGIKDAGRRHFCRAISIPRKSECEFIKDSDLRHECRARVK
jgi:hypothetical protein